MSTLVRFTAAAVIIISVFGGSVIAVAFQIAFRVEIHANDIFFIFLKIIFNISTSKRSKKYKLHSILAKKKLKI
jgi:hypothetical protein